MGKVPNRTLVSVNLSAILKANPLAFSMVAPWRANKRKRNVTRATDIVIEGYPRSGNHYALFAFMAAQEKQYQIAHHFHAPAQLILAAKYGKPAILVIRHPRQAVLSSIVHWQLTDVAGTIGQYTHFHQVLEPWLEHLVVSDFSQTTDAFHLTIDAVNLKYGTAFKSFQPSGAFDETVKSAIVRNHETGSGSSERNFPLPSREKNRLKREIEAVFEEPSIARLMEKAEDQYRSILQYAIAG